MRVVGCGMAGLLAAAMLRQNCNGIHEAQPSLPNNHSAVLRFRSTIVGDVLNIRFKEVMALKASERWRNPAADAMAYSAKTNGSREIRSIITAKGELNRRYIAPPDLIDRMFKSIMCPIDFNDAWDQDAFKIHGSLGVISTIPMPTLMKVLEYPHFDPDDFPYTSGTNINIDLIDTNAYCSLYIPNPYFPAYRISLTGSKMTIECSGDIPDEKIDEIRFDSLEKMGFPRKGNVASVSVSRPRYNKILPIDDRERKRFIVWATENYGVYSLGRFATWRPGLLLDDVVNDIRVIQKIREEGVYDQRK